MAPHRSKAASADTDATEYAHHIDICVPVLIESHSYSGDAIEVHVEGTKFFVPKSIICRTSDFFKNAAKPAWRGEDGPRPVELDDDDSARIFKLYTVWLYNGSIDRADSSLKTWEPLAQAYIMGEKFMDPTFQADILAAMVHRLSTGRKANIGTMNEIYHGTMDPSPARRLMIDICLWNDRDSLRSVANPAAELHEDLVRDLLHALMALPKPFDHIDAPWEVDADEYFASLRREL
jgi:hypothetical protein